MKVLYFIDQFPKLSETFVRDEITWMENHSHLYGVIALIVNDELLHRLADGIRRRVRHAPLHYVDRSRRPRIAIYWLMRSPIRFLSTWRLLFRERAMRKHFWNAALLAQNLRHSKPDIIHIHFASDAAQIGRFAGLLINVPFTLCVHHYDIFFKPPSNYRQLAHSAARLITISDYNRRYLMQRHKIPSRSLSVIHCGIDVERFCRTIPYPESSSRLVALLSVGRLVDVKGHKYLIDACADLQARDVDFKLTIIGDGPLRESLQNQIDAAGLSHHVILAGAQPSDVVLNALEHSQVFVMPSLSEGIPVALMEAMVMELPVVATRIKGVPELVEDERSGLLVPAEDSAQLSQAILRLISDRHMSLRLGRRGRKTVSDEFNASVEYQKLLDLWSSFCRAAGSEKSAFSNARNSALKTGL